MKSIPFLLIYTRILIGIIIGLLAFYQIDYHAIWIVILMSMGVITDIFDGIIARQLGIASEKLRVWDSNVDQFFWSVVLVAIGYLNFSFVKGNLVWIGIVVILELICYIVSYKKFKRTIATHSILAKIWTLLILVVQFTYGC